MIKRVLIIASLAMAMTVTAASAKEGEYIFQLKDDIVVPMALSDGVEKLSENGDTYKAESIEDVYEFVDESAIKYIGRDVPVYLFDEGETEFVPSDAHFYNQWNMPQINMPRVWAKGYRGEGAFVCVIDSGLFMEHEDIDKSRIVDKYNVFDKSDDITDTMKNGHGTFVTGIIGAITDNGEGIAGIADKADIFSIKAFDKDRETYTSDLVGAFEMASRYENLDVLNMSLGVPAKNVDAGTKAMLQNAVNKLVDNGTIVVAAVGNDGNSDLNYPAAFDNVIGVGGVSKNKNRCYFSQTNNSVFVVAPGGVLNAGDTENKILSLSNTLPNGIVQNSGTSFAAPHVSAVAAIAKSICHKMTQSQFMEILKNTSEDLGPAGYDTEYGYGLIDADKIIAEAEKLAQTMPSPTLTPGETASPRPTRMPEITPTPEPTSVPEFTINPVNYRELSYDKDSRRVIVDTDDTEAVVYIASFDGYTLKSVQMQKVSELTGENGRYKIYIPQGDREPTKLFLWHGMMSCMAVWENDDYVIPTESPEPAATVVPGSTGMPEETPTPTPSVTPVPENTPYPEANNEDMLLTLINVERKRAGVPEFVRDDIVMDISRSHSIDMMLNNHQNVSDTNGKDPANYILERTGKQTFVHSLIVSGGEALTSGAISKALIDNADAKSHILSEKYTHIGIGIARNSAKSCWTINLIEYLE